MQFQLSDELLQALRKRRYQQAREAKRRSPWFLPSFFGARRPSTAPSLIAQIQRLFSSRKPNIKRSAAEHVRGMDRLQAEVEGEHDAFLLDPGMGPMLYITADGRILVDGRSWDGEELREAEEDEAIRALVVGADKTGIDALLELIPPCPEDGWPCPMCCGSRWAEPVPGFQGKIVCLLCRGYGWVVQPMLDEAAAKGVWPSRPGIS